MVGGSTMMLWLMRLPCMPVELDAAAGAPSTEPAPAPAVAPAPLPPPPEPPPLPPALSMSELARYRVDYGLLSIGEISLSIEGPAPGLAAAARSPLVRARGTGEGAILGFGRLQNRVDAEFDPVRLASRRWTSARRRGGSAIRDVAEQPRQGELDLVRQEDGGPERRQQATITLAGPTLDPVGFLLRVRVAPPPIGATQILQVLDGQALWRVTLTSAGREPLPGAASIPALRLEARADPINYDGSPDGGDRPSREFVVWLSDDPVHVPLRLQMPIGIGDLVVALVSLDRRPG